jgi:hypothetical protein
MAVVEPIGATKEFRAALEASWSDATPRNGNWEARIVEGQPVVRVLISERWWDLRLRSAAWYGGQRQAYEKIASGQAADVLFFYREPANETRLANRPHSDLNSHSEIMCRIVAWLPRKRMGDEKRPQDALLARSGESVRSPR